MNIVETHSDAPNISEKNANKSRILIADDHALIRIALKNILESQEDFQVIAEAENGEEAVRLAGKLKPDIIVMDISMPKLDGLEATRIIKRENPEITIMILTVHAENQYLMGMIKAGADGYLLKNVLGSEVIESIRTIALGELVFSRQLLRQFLTTSLQESVSNKHSTALGENETLSDREISVMKMVARGLSNKEIAIQLNRSTRSIKGYLQDIFIKFGVVSRTQAVFEALRLGIVSNEIYAGRDAKDN